jgi:methyl-accepting chemotaxis protein
MNIDPQMTAGYAMVAAGGFAIGTLAGRWMMTEMRTAMSAVQTRLSTLEQTVIGHSATTTSAPTVQAALAPLPAPAPAPVAPPAPVVPAAPTAVSAATAQAAALEHHASAVEKLAAAVDKHAQAVDDHGAATVAAAVEMGSHPAPITPASTFATPLHAAGVAMGASVAPVAAAAVAAAPQS